MAPKSKKRFMASKLPVKEGDGSAEFQVLFVCKLGVEWNCWDNEGDDTK